MKKILTIALLITSAFAQADDFTKLNIGLETNDRNKICNALTTIKMDADIKLQWFGNVEPTLKFKSLIASNNLEDTYVDCMVNGYRYDKIRTVEQMLKDSERDKLRLQKSDAEFYNNL